MYVCLYMENKYGACNNCENALRKEQSEHSAATLHQPEQPKWKIGERVEKTNEHEKLFGSGFPFMRTLGCVSCRRASREYLKPVQLLIAQTAASSSLRLGRATVFSCSPVRQCIVTNHAERGSSALGWHLRETQSTFFCDFFFYNSNNVDCILIQ